AARAPMRSLLTVGLLAFAAFLIVAVESFRRHAKPGDGDRAGPDGGFALVAETDLPLVRDLNGEPGREELLDKLERRLSEQGRAPAEISEAKEAARELLKRTVITALRARAGDDASCLNLYKPRTPRLLGVPASLIGRGGFAFDAAQRPADNPWTLLEDPAEPRACFGESNTVVWMLQKGLNGEVTVPDGRGETRTLRIAGLLHDSVFQSSLLVSEANFLRLYPGHEGYHFFLIAPPAGEEDAVKKLLEGALADRGMVVERSADRVAAFLAVENTYLTTFQALGGLGLVLGSLGLAVVLLRAVWERRAELALLRALGYTRAAVGWLLLVENGFLLLLGLAIGSAAAVLSVSPQLRSGSGEVPWANLAALFAGVLATGLAACAAATWSALRDPVVPALRRE
ncbi:MAG: ABC transporter permease, partial [Gemmataceae bacterium]